MALREKQRGVRLTTSALCLVVLFALAACSGDPTGTVSPSQSNSTSAAKHVPPKGTYYLGVSSDWNRLSTFERAADITQPAIFNRWTTPDGPFEPTLALVRTRPDITPMISWNLPMTNQQITNGSKDIYIRDQADAVARYGRPVFVRLDWEMNQAINPDWSLPAVTPQQFVAGWQRVVSIFRSAGASNVSFVWAPNVFPGTTGTQAAAWYPGDAYVDWMGLDAYPQSAPPQMMLNGPDGMNSQAGFAQSRGKPLMLAEWAVTTAPVQGAASDTDAMDLVFNWAEAWPNTVKALVYFDFVTQGQDFTLNSHPDAAATYRQRTANQSVYLTSLVP